MSKVASLEGKRVLLVEDEFLVAMDIECELEDSGAKVVCAGSLASAQQCVDAGLFDAAILDLNLHGKPSYPVADRLAHMDIPFIFHTGQGERAVLLERYPGVGVYNKPCDGRSLVKALSQIIA
ncbi:response regulator [Aureimonas sp. ME7]|uniref:response regulator n=1 Tax=Aureimonas sp. ME7 TaxID=2744252 RepID=UPI001FCF1397|nr:response regulator [Aureimonas sp. ME7]